MYTQHPILTEKHRIVDIFADLLKKKTEISHGLKYSDPFSVFSRSTLLIYTAMSLFGKDSTSFSHLDLGSSAIPPCRSSPVLSGWMVNVGGQPFLGLSPEMLNWV